jgi:hypothetical protein
MSDLKEHNLKGTELWREYEFGAGEFRITYRIGLPVTLWMRPGGTTHRVLDPNGVTHIVPAPGHFGCVLRYEGKTEF